MSSGRDRLMVVRSTLILLTGFLAGAVACCIASLQKSGTPKSRGFIKLWMILSHILPPKNGGKKASRNAQVAGQRRFSFFVTVFFFAMGLPFPLTVFADAPSLLGEGRDMPSLFKAERLPSPST